MNFHLITKNEEGQFLNIEHFDKQVDAMNHASNAVDGSSFELHEGKMDLEHTTYLSGTRKMSGGIDWIATKY